MKLIHCADLHLDSQMNTHFGSEMSRIRRHELLHTFERMVDYAAESDVSGILIAGDMFDTENTTELTRNTVLSCITAHPDILFFYLKGNHDNNNFITNLNPIPENLKLFSDEWTSFSLGNVAITGIELSSHCKEDMYSSLTLEMNHFNIVMMHGQISEISGSDDGQTVILRELRNRNIDYLALGHIHTYKMEELDARGMYCYPGCLEGRGFDECGPHGFVILEIDETSHQLTTMFVPFAKRQLYTIEVDVTYCHTTQEILHQIADALLGTDCDGDSLLKIVLIGEMDVECEKDIAYLQRRFSAGYFFVKVVDETTLKIHIEDYLLEESLKGEFIRTVFNDTELSEQDKAVIIRYGLQALAGEEIQ